MSDLDRLQFRPDDVLRASDLQTILDAIRRSMGDVGGGDGVDGMTDGRGNAHVASVRRDSFVGKANGTISGRSGSTWGSGTVTRYAFDGSADYTVSASYTVINPSVGIPDGLYCRVEEDPDGNMVVRPLTPVHGYCQLGSTLAAASGSWPSVTPTSTSATVYVGVGSSQVTAGSATIRNRRNVSWVASKTCILEPNDEGSWDIIDQDC